MMTRRRRRTGGGEPEEVDAMVPEIACASAAPGLAALQTQAVWLVARACTLSAQSGCTITDSRRRRPPVDRRRRRRRRRRPRARPTGPGSVPPVLAFTNLHACTDADRSVRHIAAIQSSLSRIRPAATTRLAAGGRGAAGGPQAARHFGRLATLRRTAGSSRRCDSVAAWYRTRESVAAGAPPQ